MNDLSIPPAELPRALGHHAPDYAAYLGDVTPAAITQKGWAACKSHSYYRATQNPTKYPWHPLVRRTILAGEPVHPPSVIAAVVHPSSGGR